MMKLRMISIRDPALLQELVIQQIDLIEGQVQVMEVGIYTEWGQVIIGQDKKGRLVALLLDLIQDETLLLRLIEVYAWIRRIMPLLSRFYAKRGLDSTRAPRIIVVAPGYSVAVADGIEYLTFGVELYIYRGIEINGQRSTLLEPVVEPQVQKSKRQIKGQDPSEVLLMASRLTEAEVRSLKDPELHSPNFPPDRPRLETS